MNTSTDNPSDETLRGQRESIGRGLLRTNTAAVAILLVVIGLALAALLQADRAGRERERAVQAEREARERLWHSYEAQARGARASTQAGHRFESLEALRSATSIRPSLDLRNDAIASLTLADLRLARALPSFPHIAVALNETFERYALLDREGRIQVRRCVDEKVLLELPALTNAAQFVSPFSPDERSCQ